MRIPRTPAAARPGASGTSGASAGALLAAFAVALGCGACALLPWYAVSEDAFARDTVVVECCVAGGATVTLTYLGVGGWIFEVGGDRIMTAPLYSNPGFVETGLSPIRAEPDVIDRELPDVSDVSAILVGHGHYDHLMDVPWIMEHRAREALLYANATSWWQVEPFGFTRRALEDAGDALRPAPGDGRVVVLTGALAGDDEAAGRWFEAAPRVRVMALRSDHAPHLAGVTLYSGSRSRRMPRPPLAAPEWLDGETYAFLIDLLAADGSVAMRIYYQDAVAAPPAGLVPPFADGTVDLALVVPATYAEVNWQPEAIIEDAGPRHVLLGHWEDFFQPPDAEPEPVPFTLLKDFLGRLEGALPPGVGYHMPVPGTTFVFR